MATELYLVRHGQTEENAANILQGHLPGHLNAAGIEQAQQLAKRLSGMHFDALLCSDLQRCVDTAAILNRGRGLPVEYTTLLRERDWGPFTGMNTFEARRIIDQRAESIEALYQRAETFLSDVAARFDGCTVLAVSHGQFCRAIQGACLGKPIRDIPRMENAEVRRLTLTVPLRFDYDASRIENEVSAN